MKIRIPHNIEYTKFRISTIVFFLLFISYNLYSQNNYLKIKYYSLKDGLSQVSCNSLIHDKSGFIWIATENGLNRFDGTEFKHFKYNKSDSFTISGNYIKKLMLDETGRIWIGTVGNGLNYYKPEQETFHQIKLKFSESKNETITSLTSDEEGNIWVTSQISGLHKLHPQKNGSFIQNNFFPNQPLNALLLDKNNVIWIGGFEGEIFKVDLNNKVLSKTPIPQKIEGQINAFYQTDNAMLIGSGAGFYIYDFQTKQSELIELSKGRSFQTKHVNCFLKAGPSSVWIGTGNGLYLFNWVNKSVVREIKYSGNNNDGLSNNTVLSLLQLSNNQVFVGTSNKLNLLDFNEPYFKNISKNKRGKHLLNDNVVFSILKDETDLWIGTSDGGLNLIRNNKTYYFKEDLNNSASISGVVRGLVKDIENQRLWVATTQGLNKIDLETFNPDNPEFTTYLFKPNDSNSISSDFIKDIALDKKNNLWGATFGQGIFRLSISKQNKVEILRFKSDIDNPKSLVNDFAQCIEVDKENNIWVGTQGGLTKLSANNEDLGEPEIINYYQSENSNKPLSHNSVYDILIGVNDSIWLGTRNGLNLFLGNNEFDSWSDNKHLLNNVIYSVQDDELGNLWLGTNEGIVSYNTDTKIVKQYGVEDGIQGKEFDIHAKFRDEQGNVYLGGIAGLTYFHPRNLDSIDRAKPLYFSQLRIKDQIVTPKNSVNGLVSKTISRTQNLKFKHDQFPFYLRFSSIDYRLNKDVTYAYKLFPSNTEWNQLKDPEIQFLNLPSGKYTLQINGFSRGKEWLQPPLEMKIEVTPPLWARWWAYVIYLLVFIFFADRFYRFQLSKKLAVAESKRLKEVNELKNTLFTNITHEFRTPLTVIKGMAGSIKSRLKDSKQDELENSLEMIDRNSDGLLHLVNEMLDLAKLESGNMELQLVQVDVIPFIKYLSESFSSLADENKISLTIYSEIDSLLMDYDADKLASIISNLLSNAIKFTPEFGKIIVHINQISQKENAFLFIKIKDNGIGISKEELPNIFNRFYQTDSSTIRENEGTGIGLALTKELVEVMKGTIEVTSILNKGSEFRVMIPVTRNAPRINNTQIENVSHTYLSQTSPIYNEQTIVLNSELPLVLIIEDNLDVVHYLKTCLLNKYETIHAVNGIEGIEMALEKIPDIIISDVMMPGKDGFEVCETLKSDERSDHIPIVLLTAKVTIEDRLTGLSHGADAYLAKPFNKEELFTRLDQLISLRKKLINKLQKEGLRTLLKKKPKNPQLQFLEKVEKLIHENIGNSSFGSGELANKLLISESQVYRKIKAITGKSTAVFIRSIRLQHAKELLLSADKTVSEVAYEVGFNDPSWFSRAFKDEFGVTPSSASK